MVIEYSAIVCGRFPNYSLKKISHTILGMRGSLDPILNLHEHLQQSEGVVRSVA